MLDGDSRRLRLLKGGGEGERRGTEPEEMLQSIQEVNNDQRDMVIEGHLRFLQSLISIMACIRL